MRLWKTCLGPFTQIVNLSFSTDRTQPPPFSDVAANLTTSAVLMPLAGCITRAVLVSLAVSQGLCYRRWLRQNCKVGVAGWLHHKGCVSVTGCFTRAVLLPWAASEGRWCCYPLRYEVSVPRHLFHGLGSALGPPCEDCAGGRRLRN